MNVKSYWVDKDTLLKTPVEGTPVCQLNLLTMEGVVIGKIGKVEDDRALIVLDVSVPFEALEQQGVGFTQFEDTED